MNPLTRLSWALGASLLIWLPVVITSLNGRMDATRAGLLYLGALAIAWFGTAIVSNLVSGYRNTIDRAEAAKRQIALLEEQATQAQRRRSTDQDNGEAP